MRVMSFLATLLLVFPMTPLAAPPQTGSLAGIITDPAGQGLPGARIRVIAADGHVREATTDTVGRYTIGQMPSGRHRIEAAMAGFETKVSAVTVVAGGITDWSGALLLAGAVIGEASIERRVMRETGWEALDCGRHAAPAEADALEKSLACAVDAARRHQPFAVILQRVTGGHHAGHGLLGGAGGVIQRFEYERGGLTFRIRVCASPGVASVDRHAGAGFTCAQ